MKRPGPFIRPVTIEKRVQSLDGAGGFIESWVTHAPAMADIKPVSASEQYFADQLLAQSSHRITIRYVPGIAAKMRVSYSSAGVTRIFQIHGVIRIDERNRYITLLCQEGAGS